MARRQIFGLEPRQFVSREIGNRLTSLIQLQAVLTGGVNAEYRVFYRTISRTKWREIKFVLQVVRQFDPAKSLNLPLRRPEPDRVRPPEHVIGAKTF